MTPQSEAYLDRVKLAARLYYTDGLPQAEVARILEASQAMVSRLLQQARAKGIVRITVEDYQPRDLDLEQRLREAFPQLASPSSTVVVVRNPVEATIPGIRRSVGYFGASLVADRLRAAGDAVVGITGGRTLAELIARLHSASPRPAAASSPRPRVVTLMGSIGAAVNDDDAAELARSLADSFGGACYSLNTPAVVSSPASRNAIASQGQVRSVFRLFSEMTTAVVGVGTVTESAFIDRRILEPADLKELQAAGAVGEIAGRYFDTDGRECDTRHRRCVVGCDLEDLRRAQEVTAVTAGPGRGLAVATAIRTGLLNSLLTDEQCALATLSHATPRPSPRRPSARTRAAR